MLRARRRTVVTTAAAVFALLVAALVVTVVTHGSGEASGNMVAYPVGQRPAAPEFTATSLTGTPINFAGYRGKIVVLNVWGSWCSPCRGESQTLRYLDEQYGPKGVVFLGDDIQDTPTSALAFTRGAGISYPSVNDSNEAVEQRLAIAVPIAATPTTLVIDKTGHIAGMIDGAVTYPDLSTLLRDAAVPK